MGHYFESGFSVRKPMWHGLGTVADQYPADWAEARAWAGLLWEPMTITPPPFMYNGIEINLDEVRVILRDDTYGVLGVVTDEYEPVKNASMGDIVETILSAGFKFETAGVLRNGKAVWALAYLDEPFKVAGDDSETFPYLAILNDHTGNGACKAVFTDVRVVCWNTYSAALARSKAATSFTFRHVGGVNTRIDEAKEAMKGVRLEATEWQAAAKDLFDTKLVNEDEALNHFLAQWEPTKYRELTKTERAAGLTELPEASRAHTDRARKVFRGVYLDSVTVAAHRGTALGLVDTAAEFCDHLQGREAGRMGRFLTGDPRKKEAVMLARKVAG